MEENLAPVITTLLGKKYTISQEDRVNDEVFNNHDLPTYHTPTVDQDSAYKKPDKEQYIFSTMGGSLYTLYSNNMILPIRSKDRLKYSYQLNKRLMSDVNKKEDRGVYIIDYYRISSMVAFDPNFLHNIINYYHTTQNLYPEQIEVQEHIKEQLHLNKTKDAFKQPHTVLRIVTFIPEEDIRKHGHVFVPTSDIVIGYGYISNKMIHPNSPLYKERRKVTTSNVKNFIEIDIVDTATGYDRYLRVGNKVVTLKASRDPDRKDKAMMIVYKDNFAIEHYECELGKLEEDLGIFRTEEEARSNGDIKTACKIEELENEKQKMAYERDKLLVDQEKLNVERDKIAKDLEKAKMELESMQVERDMLLDKQEHERDKIKLEKMIMELKHNMAYAGHLMDMQKKKYEFETTVEMMKLKRDMEISKHRLETDKMLRDIEAYGIKHGIDLEIQHMKANSAKYNSLISMGRDVLSTATTLAKLA